MDVTLTHFLLQVFIQKPLGIRFGRGKDAGAYVTRVDKSAGNIDERIEVSQDMANETFQAHCSETSASYSISCVDIDPTNAVPSLV